MPSFFKKSCEVLQVQPAASSAQMEVLTYLRKLYENNMLECCFQLKNDSCFTGYVSIASLCLYAFTCLQRGRLNQQKKNQQGHNSHQFAYFSTSKPFQTIHIRSITSLYSFLSSIFLVPRNRFWSWKTCLSQKPIQPMVIMTNMAKRWLISQPQIPHVFLNFWLMALRESTIVVQNFLKSTYI